LNQDYYVRGQHELSNDVFVISVASFIAELEPIEVQRQIFLMTIKNESIVTISAMWPWLFDLDTSFFSLLLRCICATR